MSENDKDIRIRTDHVVAGHDSDGVILHRTLTLIAVGKDASAHKYIFEGCHWNGLYVIVEGVHRSGYSRQELNMHCRHNYPPVFDPSVTHLHQDHEIASPENIFPDKSGYNPFFRHVATEWMTQEYLDCTPEGRIAYVREMFSLQKESLLTAVSS